MGVLGLLQCQDMEVPLGFSRSAGGVDSPREVLCHVSTKNILTFFLSGFIDHVLLSGLLRFS